MRFWPLPLFALTLAAQTPSFEVASIRPTTLPTTGSICGSRYRNPDSILSSESLLSSDVQALIGLLFEAYYDEVDDVDVPQWARTGPFAISVRIPPNTSAHTCRKMLQNLLAQRFHAVTNVETREMTRYHLKVAKSGLKLKPADPPDNLDASVTITEKDGLTRRTYRGAPMSRIINGIRGHADREAFAQSIQIVGVVDETGLIGYYDGEFAFPYSIASLRNELAESLNDALSRQLGLTLELRKTPGRVLVLRSSDHMPTEN